MRQGHQAAAYEEGAYDPGTTEATYAELLRRARVLLERGHPVVLDATWREPGWREAAQRVAVEVSADLTELRCTLPVAEAVRRAEVRQRQGRDPSDAGPEVVRLLAGGEPPWPTAMDLATMGPPGLLLLLGMLVSAFRRRPRLALPFALGMFADGTFLGAAYWVFFALYTAESDG